MGAIQAAEKKYAIDFTPEEKKVIRAQFFPPSATDVDMQFCMTVAKEMGLNPLLHEIYFVERRAKVNNQWVTKIEPMPGRNAWIKLAHASGKFAGLESDAKIERFPKLVDGQWVEEDDLVATAKVWRTDMKDPVVVKVNFSEYAQKTKEGNLTQFWREKPTTMLKKVAEVQALKKAFAVSGLYDPAEVEPFENEEPIDAETVKALKNKAKPTRRRIKKAEAEAIAKAEEKEVAVEAEVVDEKSDQIPYPLGENTSVKVTMHYHDFIAAGVKRIDLKAFVVHFGLDDENVESIVADKEGLKRMAEEFYAHHGKALEPEEIPV